VGLSGILDEMAKKKGFSSFKEAVQAKKDAEDAKRTYADPVFPADFYHAQSKPEGADEAVDKLIKTGFPQLAAILQSGADAIGVQPEQISPFRDYVRPTAPGAYEVGYAAGIFRQHGVTLGEVSTEEIMREQLKQGLKDAAKEVAIETAVSLIPAPAGVPVASMIKVGIDFVKNPDTFKTPEGMLQAGFAVASFVPVLNIAAFVGQAVTTVVGIGKAKEHAKAEAQRAKAFGRMVKEMVDVSVTEAADLAAVLAERNIEMRTAPDAGWLDRLKTHYRQLETLGDMDRDAARLATKGKSTGPFGAFKDALKQHEAETLGRTEKLTFFLQLARDMRRVREALELKISLKGTALKDAATVSAETKELAYRMLQENPEIPFQQAMNLASKTARALPEPISPEQSAGIATHTVEKIEEIQGQQKVTSLIVAGAAGVFGVISMLRAGG
jgi:hypothetical protein